MLRSTSRYSKQWSKGVGPYITTPLQSSIYMPIPSALVHITNFKSLTFVNCDIICGFFSHLLSLNGTHLHRVCIQKPPLSHNYRSVIRPLSNYNILKYVGICLCIFPTSQLTKTLKTTSLSIFLTTYFMFSLFGFLEMKFLHPVISSAWVTFLNIFFVHVALRDSIAAVENKDLNSPMFLNHFGFYFEWPWFRLWNRIWRWRYHGKSQRCNKSSICA